MRRLPFPVAAVLLAGVVTGALWIPFGSWWPDGGHKALIWASGACVLTAFLAHAGGVLIQRRMKDPEEQVLGHQAALAIRMLLTLTAALVIMRSGAVPKMAFAIAISVVYCLLLALEVFATLEALRQNHRPKDT